ncbi:hypothetical protein BT93_F1886 [Corymbia citriodora subsp. variegata]|nr:hypothetical protein BT93_F1886 [Corymbia citriodora subsp. variegata]
MIAGMSMEPPLLHLERAPVTASVDQSSAEIPTPFRPLLPGGEAVPLSSVAGRTASSPQDFRPSFFVPRFFVRRDLDGREKISRPHSLLLSGVFALRGSVSTLRIFPSGQEPGEDDGTTRRCELLWGTGRSFRSRRVRHFWARVWTESGRLFCPRLPRKSPVACATAKLFDTP